MTQSKALGILRQRTLTWTPPPKDPTYISATITMPYVVNQDKPKPEKASSDTISSPIRKDGLETFRAPTNNLDV